jgi:hypothetical protein
MRTTVLVVGIICAVSLALTSHAVEGGSGHYTSGTYLDFCGMPPTQPGFYLANYFLDYGNAEAGANKQLPRGGIFAAGLEVNAQAEAPGVLYAWRFGSDNLTFSSGIYPSWIWEDVSATATFDKNGNQISGARSQSVNGFGDLQLTPIAVGWTNGDFSMGGMFNVWVPSGTYNPSQLANPGLGYYTFELMPAFSWMSSKLGTEFTVFPAVDFNTINNTTDYKSGDIFHVDATLAQHLPLGGGFIGAGASVSYIKQFTGDSGSGARLGSFEEESVAVGPTVSYILPLGKKMLIVDGSWLPQVKTVNTTQGNYFWAKLTFVF